MTAEKINPPPSAPLPSAPSAAAPAVPPPPANWRLAREGWGLVGGAAAAAALATWWAGADAWPLWVVLAFVTQFFRDPLRAVNAAAADGAVLAPADGRVVFVGRSVNAPVEEAGEKIKISVFMNVFNVHSNRIPATGEVVRSQRFAGKFFNAALDKSSEHNERHLLAIATPFGEIFCMQIAGLLARRVFCYANTGDKVAAGARYGFIRFGSRVDVYLPPTSRPLVSIGDKVSAGIHPIATLSEENTPPAPPAA